MTDSYWIVQRNSGIANLVLESRFLLKVFKLYFKKIVSCPTYVSLIKDMY